LEARGWQPITDPVPLFADLAGEIWEWKESARARVDELESWSVTNLLTGAEDVRAIVQVYEKALDRAHRTLVDMLRIGLTAEHLRQAKERPSREQAEIFQRVLDKLLGALMLTPEQRALIPQALSAALRDEGLV